jgi:hypothetical protein
MEWMNREGVLVAQKQGIYYRIDGTELTASKDGKVILEYYSNSISRLMNKALEHSMQQKPKRSKMGQIGAMFSLFKK